MDATERIGEIALIQVRNSAAGKEGFQFLRFGGYGSGLQQTVRNARSSHELAGRQNRYASGMPGREQRRAGAEAGYTGIRGMRLWHQKLIPYLDNKRILGQHRECCALRGGGWGRKHSVVDYVFRYEPARLYAYHVLVMDEMVRRGFNPDAIWYDRLYRGKNLPPFTFSATGSYGFLDRDVIIYPKHDDVYLAECLDNLSAKGAELVNGESLASMRVRLAAKKGI